MPSVYPRLGFATKTLPAALLFVSPDAGDIPPVLESGTGYPLMATFVATGGVAPLGYTLFASDLPSGVVLDLSTGVLSGLFPPNDFPPAELPTWVTPAGSLSGTYNEGSPISLQLDADPAPGRTLDKYSVIYGILPFGATLNPVTGEIMGMLADVGGGDTTQPNVPPTWVTPAGSLGSVLAENVLAPPISVQATYNGTATSVKYSITGGSLPFGLQLDLDTGDIAGTPQAVVGIVDYLPPPTWVTPAGSLGTFADGDPVSVFVQATAVDTQGYSLVRGALPSGLQLNGATGEISGTVEHTPTSPTFAFAIRALLDGGFLDRNFSLTTTP